MPRDNNNNFYGDNDNPQHIINTILFSPFSQGNNGITGATGSIASTGPNVLSTGFSAQRTSESTINASTQSGNWTVTSPFILEQDLTLLPEDTLSKSPLVIKQQ
ncbi:MULTISPECIES: hypothetical protein [Virgibacillus]|uniref:Uncharacterized protein n=1 Tax=Virgibacillus massiliensis TaxID=1462526 RepID=A0A024QGI3_9BACI|nr:MULTISPECIES: hypothetical protein [Virgibacillus]EQB37031.1 hypothetical protein M948_11435 [Virgibacillus sp. CM-4]CDQ41663.1 hypothetical protein BN990_04037 [Virgibacillus massiliensis]